MKKLRLVFIALALIAGVGGAFAMRTDPNCIWEMQYRKIAGGYIPVWGEFGVHYYCEDDETSSCTYYWDYATQQYLYCRIGRFTWIPE
ncbi:MAG TPA: DUF6520 family protein [Cytophagaceae bacterium]